MEKTFVKNYAGLARRRIGGRINLPRQKESISSNGILAITCSGLGAGRRLEGRTVGYFEYVRSRILFRCWNTQEFCSGRTVVKERRIL